MMKKVRNIFVCLFAIGCLCAYSAAGGKGKAEPAAAVAGVYDGETFVELLQMRLKLKLELQRVHRDSVVVSVTDFVLPTGQKFSYRSRPIAVKPAVRDGKTVYRLATTFTYDYNGMPMEVNASGTVAGDSLDSQVRASIMGAFETNVTYKARRLPE